MRAPIRAAAPEDEIDDEPVMDDEDHRGPDEHSDEEEVHTPRTVAEPEREMLESPDGRHGQVKREGGDDEGRQDAVRRRLETPRPEPLFKVWRVTRRVGCRTLDA
jgi:hypothetical protein